MGCNKKLKTTPATTEECNELITDIENSLSDTFGVKTKYKGELRNELIKTIKENPDHLWEVTNNGLIHYAFR